MASESKDSPADSFQALLVERRVAWLIHQEEELFRTRLRQAVSGFRFHTRSGQFCSLFKHKLEYMLIVFSRQGFAKENLTPGEAVHVLFSCERRLGRTFTMEEIESGVLGQHLTDADYHLPDRVSRSPITHLNQISLPAYLHGCLKPFQF